MTTTVSTQGSVALPEELLRETDLHPGDELEVLAEDGDIVLRKVTAATQARLLDILHSLKGLPLPERARSLIRDVQL